MSNEISADTRARADVFGKAYAEWAQAFAAQATMDGVGGASDEEGDAIIERLAAAERKLAGTPAALENQLVTKFEILEHMLSMREHNGPPYDGRHMLMLASIKLDLYRFHPV
jgi:hypothetical protein